MSRWLVILAGGRGERFWPLSRAMHPKQFLALVGDRTMLQRTRDRVRGLIPDERIVVVTGADYVAKVQDNLPGIPAHHILGEPVGRNTAASIAWAASCIFAEDPDGMMLVLPSDHMIQRVASFRRVVQEAMSSAETTPGFYTFGIIPTHAETGYGYIEVEQRRPSEDGTTILKACHFIEKPERQAAQVMVDSGHYYWNSGMFVFRVRDYLDAVERFIPALTMTILKMELEPDRIAETFAEAPSISVDHGIMERVEPVYVLPADIGWDDVGTFAALSRLLPRNGEQNAAKGHAVFVDSQNVTAISDGPVVSFIGVKDLVVVATPDAVLILPPDRAQDVRAVVEALRAGQKEHLL